MTTLQRTNVVLNPRAALDVAGWNSYNDYVVRVEAAPVDFPEGTTTAFAVPGYPTGLPAITDHWALPDDVVAGTDYLYASCYAYVDGVEPHEVSFWASLKFFDDEDNEIDWMAFAHDEIAPLEKFERFVGLIKVPEDAATFHVFIKTDLVIPDIEPSPDLYFTMVQVENAYGRARLPWSYADGDSDGWSWFAAPHISHSLCDTTGLYIATEPVETDVAIPSGDWLTLPPMTEDLFVGVVYGDALCHFSSAFVGGLVYFTPTTADPAWGDALTVTWEPAEGYQIDDVKLDDASIGTPTEKVWEAFTSDHVIVAYSSGIERTITYAAAANGSIEGDSEQTQVYNSDFGTDVTAVPDEGYEFVAWSDGYLYPTRRDSQLLENTLVTATFALLSDTTVTLTYSAATGGTIDGLSEQEVEIGQSGSPVEAIPDEGYNFLKWDDEFDEAYRVDAAVTEDITVEAQFTAQETVVVSWQGGAHGMVQAEGGTPTMALVSILEVGSDADAVTAIADGGWRFAAWDDGVKTATRIDKDITSAATYIATYVEDVEEPSSYTLSYSAGSGGSIEGDAEQDVDAGGNGTPVRAAPDSGYLFDSWSDAFPAHVRLDTNVHDDLTVTATFVLRGLPVYYFTCRHGTISGDSRQNVAYGEDATTVEAVPKPGYRFTKWSDGVLTAARTDLAVTSAKYVWARYARGTPS